MICSNIELSRHLYLSEMNILHLAVYFSENTQPAKVYLMPDHPTQSSYKPPILFNFIHRLGIFNILYPIATEAQYEEKGSNSDRAMTKSFGV